MKYESGDSVVIALDVVGDDGTPKTSDDVDKVVATINENISAQWTLEERLKVVERLSGGTLDKLYGSTAFFKSTQPVKNLELVYIVATKPAEDLEVRRDEILRALAEK